MSKRNFVERFGRVLALLILATMLLLITISASLMLFSTYHRAHGFPPFMTQDVEASESGFIYAEAEAHPTAVIAIASISLFVGFFAGLVWCKQTRPGAKTDL